MIFEKLKTLIETHGNNVGDNYSLYNFNNVSERLDYDKVTGLVTYTTDNYATDEQLLNYTNENDEKFLNKIYLLFEMYGSKYDY